MPGESPPLELISWAEGEGGRCYRTRRRTRLRKARDLLRQEGHSRTCRLTTSSTALCHVELDGRGLDQNKAVCGLNWHDIVTGAPPLTTISRKQTPVVDSGKDEHTHTRIVLPRARARERALAPAAEHCDMTMTLCFVAVRAVRGAKQYRGTHVFYEYAEMNTKS